MTERPIIFSAKMIQQILHDRKTQTRRIVRNPNILKAGPFASDLCPYGKAGDHLWVRETWGDKVDVGILYKADLPSESPYHRGGVVWKPSIHMARCLSRITLEIVGVRFERLQEISYNDIIDEGLRNWLTDEQQTDASHRWAAKKAFAELWNQINRKRTPWESNPWVWVIEFRRLTQSKGGGTANRRSRRT